MFNLNVFLSVVEFQTRCGSGLPKKRSGNVKDEKYENIVFWNHIYYSLLPYFFVIFSRAL